MDYVPETVYRVLKHYNKMKPTTQIKLKIKNLVNEFVQVDDKEVVGDDHCRSNKKDNEEKWFGSYPRNSVCSLGCFVLEQDSETKWQSKDKERQGRSDEKNQ